MSKVNNIVLVEVPDGRRKHLRCFKKVRTNKLGAPFVRPMKNLDEGRLPRDVFQRSGKITEGSRQNNGK